MYRSKCVTVVVLVFLAISHAASAEDGNIKFHLNKIEPYFIDLSRMSEHLRGGDRDIAIIMSADSLDCYRLLDHISDLLFAHSLIRDVNEQLRLEALIQVRVQTARKIMQEYDNKTSKLLSLVRASGLSVKANRYQEDLKSCISFLRSLDREASRTRGSTEIR